MEHRIINHNTRHFKKLHSSKIYNDPTHELLPNNTVRDKIFNGTLDENDYEDEDVRHFLKLLQDKESSKRTNHSPWAELEWENIVKEA